jgi:hypothetical protein
VKLSQEECRLFSVSGTLGSQYTQSTGRFIVYDSQGNVVLDTVGYSGHSAGLNNPNHNLTVDIGPVPVGEWTIGTGYAGGLGNPQFRLTHVSGAVGPRDPTSFLIHADYTSLVGPNGFSYVASSGCIILTASARQSLSQVIAAYGGSATLTVTAH